MRNIRDSALGGRAIEAGGSVPSAGARPFGPGGPGAAHRELRAAGGGPFADVGALLAGQRAPSGGAGAAGAASLPPGGEGEAPLTERELKAIERDHPEGLTSVQIVNFFTVRGVRFSEATFRKYVQQGLLPRSRRVGRKGKHQGSLGLYPATTVRRISAIKRLMASDFTIEDIQRRFLRFRDEIENIERGLETVLSGFEEETRAPHFDTKARRDLKRDVAEARKTADEMMRRIGDIERRIAEPRERPSGAGAPGGAEDLL